MYIIGCADVLKQVNSDFDFADINYLGWQEPPSCDDDGYFWTSKCVIRDILKRGGYNTQDHPFLFETVEDARAFLRLRNIIVNYLILIWDENERMLASSGLFIAARCVSERITQISQIEKGKDYILDLNTLYTDSDGDTYVETYEVGKDLDQPFILPYIGKMHTKHFRLDYRICECDNCSECDCNNLCNNKAGKSNYEIYAEMKQKLLLSDSTTSMKTFSQTVDFIRDRKGTFSSNIIEGMCMLAAELFGLDVIEVERCVNCEKYWII